MSTALHDDAVAVLTAWDAPDPGQRALQHAFLGLLAARHDACRRSCKPGHLTASAVVMSHDFEDVLLTLHPRVGRWIQLGGHCEAGDTGLAAAALREATEESGIPDLELRPEPLHLDVHPITCSLGAPTRHFDVRYLVVAPPGAVPVRSDESTDLRWWPVHELPDNAERDTVETLVDLARERAPLSPERQAALDEALRRIRSPGSRGD